MKTLGIAALGLLVGFSGALSAQDEDGLSARIEAAMQADIRSDAEKERDDNRRPVETLAFFGIEEDMQVLELLPGGGWYTKLLAPALADTGKLYVSLGTGRVVDNVLGEPGFDQVDVLDPGVSFSRDEESGFFTLEPFSFGVEGLDAVLTFRNMHNFTVEGRTNINRAVLEALKSGGVYGVVDHTRRHMQADDNENRRRVDPVLIIHELTQLGFEFVGFSDLHYRLDDELRFEVGRRSVSGNTDRFTLLFRKP